MPEAWANEGPDQYPHDMEPDGNYKLKVDIDRECNAIEAGNANANGKALKVSQGETEILDQVTIDKDVNGVTLSVTNEDGGANARALKVEGKAEINDIVMTNRKIDGSGNMLELGTTHASTNETIIGHSSNDTIIRGEHLLVFGYLDAEGDPLGSEFDLPLGTKNYTRDVKISRSGKTTTVQGKLEVDEGIEDVNIKSIKVGPSDAAGEIDSGGSVEVKQDLRIGLQSVTNDVRIAHNDRKVILGGSLRVGAKQEEGDAGPINRIDSHAGLQTKPLYIGTLIETGRIQFSRTGQQIDVKGRIDAEEHIRVGPINDTGQIDANGSPAAQNLEIGSNNTTANVELGRPDQTVDMQCQARMNSNAIIMDDAANLIAAAGCGQVFNPDGHPGPLEPCIDFYINGVCTFYVDSTGGHNV